MYAGRVVEEPYKARITGQGARHPVTRDLPGSEQNPPAWGEWLRIVGAQVRTGTAVMSGAGDLPLLLLSREDKGRVVVAFLENFFARYVEYDFTAALEEQLDRISNNEISWQQVLKDQGWTDSFITGDEFGSFLDEESQRVQGVLSELGLT